MNYQIIYTNKKHINGRALDNIVIFQTNLEEEIVKAVFDCCKKSLLTSIYICKSTIVSDISTDMTVEIETKTEYYQMYIKPTNEAVSRTEFILPFYSEQVAKNMFFCDAMFAKSDLATRLISNFDSFEKIKEKGVVHYIIPNDFWYKK